MAHIDDDIPYFYNWTLSPDGSMLAMAKKMETTAAPVIRLLTLKDGKERSITLKEWSSINALDWTADGKSLWVSASTTTEANALLKVGSAGKSAAGLGADQDVRRLGDSVARWTRSRLLASQRQLQCLDGGGLLTGCRETLQRLLVAESGHPDIAILHANSGNSAKPNLSSCPAKCTTGHGTLPPRPLRNSSGSNILSIECLRLRLGVRTGICTAMRILDKPLLEQLSAELAVLYSDMFESEASLLKRPLGLHEGHRRSARNLAHYLALRRHDVRQLQTQLALLGLSSLGRTESHVLNAVQTVHRVLNALLGTNGSLPCPEEPAVEMGEGTELLEANTDALLGPPPPGRRVRIMVTMSSDAATDYELVRDLVRNGMDCMRINCAHDNPEAWLGMIGNLRKAREETGRNCRILMDVAGPKLRTGPIEPGPSVIKCRPSVTSTAVS